MTIERMISLAIWTEKIVTPEKTIFSFDLGFDEAKKKFLGGDKETRNWVLVAFQIQPMEGTA